MMSIMTLIRPHSEFCVPCKEPPNLNYYSHSIMMTGVFWNVDIQRLCEWGCINMVSSS
jgi:hypothetical protein